MESFPDAKFIVLWRNPLAVAASMIQTWGQGSWNLFMFQVDLYRGLDFLVSSFNSNKNRCIAVKYENLVTSPNEEMVRIMSYLDLKYDVNVLDAFKYAKKIEAQGRGDPTGQHKYKKVSTDSLHNWKLTLANPFRKLWSKNYLKWVGQERLNLMGYDFNKLYSDIDSEKVTYQNLASDIVRNIYGKIYCKYSINIVRNNIPWHKNIYFYKN